LFGLRWKLGGALLLVVLVSVGLMAFLTNRDTTDQFQQYVQYGNTVYVQRVTDNLSQYYIDNHGWSGVSDILQANLRNNNDRLILAETSGTVIADTVGVLNGKPSTAINSGSAVTILAAGQPAGILYYDLSSAGMGRGYKGGRGSIDNGSAVAQIGSQSPENNFLNRVNSYLWIAGVIAVVVAFLLGILLTRQITRPLQRLKTGAKHISEGDLGYRVKINSSDEIGQLAESFNEMAVKLDNSEQSRRRLVSDVAHELKTPLTVIQGTVTGIEDGIFSADKEHL